MGIESIVTGLHAVMVVPVGLIPQVSSALEDHLANNLWIFDNILPLPT
jgi:hypothetical protein